jgi:hypothetical protein
MPVKKRKNPKKGMSIRVYGIWSKKKNKMIYTNLSKEDTELEYDMEGYNESAHIIVCLDALYDISSLGL